MRMLAAGFALLVAVIAVRPLAAHDIAKGDLVISAPWLRATPAGAEVAAGYLSITNKGTSADRLVSFSTEISGQPEVHEMSNEGGVMKMRPLKGGLAIPAGATVKLQPAGYHLMLMKLKKPLAAGQHYKAILVFEKAGPVEVDFEVRAMGTGQSKSHTGHNH